MAKTRSNRKDVTRMQRRAAYARATQVKLMVEDLPNQASLDAFLLQEKDTAKRAIMYDQIKQWIKFPNPEFPSDLRIHSRIIRP